MSRLLVNPGTPDEWEIQLKPGSNVLGRSADCDFRIEHGSVSGTHCQITLENSSARLRDLGSTNGTFLDRAPVHEASLKAGQCIQLGSVELQYVVDPPVGDAPAPASVRFEASRTGEETLSAGGPPVGLRVARSESPSAGPSPAAPPAYVPDEYSASPVAPAGCKYHPKSIARWLCPQCQVNFCDLCVGSRPGGTRSGQFCRRCSSECVALNVQIVPEGVHAQNFFAMAPSAFAYPFRGSGVIFLICGAIGFAILDFLRNYGGLFAIGLNVIYGGYLFAFMQRVIQTAAQGSDEPPSWPDVTEFYQDIIQPFLQMLATTLVCFGPAIIFGIWAVTSGASGGAPNPSLGIGLIILGILGALYYPMALLAVAMFDSVVALSPHVVIPAVFRVPLEYFVVLVLAAVIFAAYAAQVLILSRVNVPIVPELVASFVWLYLLIVQMRLLGLMYYAKRDRLGWFHQPRQARF
jgi:hypothetical protein